MKRNREEQYNSPSSKLGKTNSAKENSPYAPKPRGKKLGGKYQVDRNNDAQRNLIGNFAGEDQPDRAIDPPATMTPPVAENLQPAVAIHPQPPMPINLHYDSTHFNSYQMRLVNPPEDVLPRNLQIFTILHQLGHHFLYQKANKRYWANYPPFEKTFILPHPVAKHQIHLSISPFDHSYRATWVSAIAKNSLGQAYPLHIISHNTLSRTANLITYPQRIKNLFESFIPAWPEGMQRMCMVIDVDTEAQKYKIINDYEALVNSYGLDATAELPNIRIYYDHKLTNVYTPENCRQRGLRLFRRPDQLIRDLANKRAALLRLEVSEFKTIRPDVAPKAFQAACQAFIQSPNMAQELATTHFSITEINTMINLLLRAKQRMDNFLTEIYNGFDANDLISENVQFLINKTIESIARLDDIIARLTSLRMSYLNYSTCLANLLSIDLMQLNNAHGIASISYELNHIIEDNLYSKVAELMSAQGIAARFREFFPSGHALLACLMAKNVPLNSPGSSREQCQALVGHITEIMAPAQPILAY